MELDPFIMPYTKLTQNNEYITVKISFIIKPWTYQKKTWENVHDIGFCNNFLDTILKHREENKNKIDHLYLIKIKTFLH